MSYHSYSASGSSGSGEGSPFFIDPVASSANLPLSAPNGTVCLAKDTGILWKYNTSTVAWEIVKTLNYTAENITNKSTDGLLGSSDTLYPSQKAVKTYVDTIEADKLSFGFLNQTETAISFNDSNYTFTIAPTSTTWSYYRSGIKYTITGSKTVTLAGSPPTANAYYIYIDSTDGTLTASTTPWTLEDTKVPVSTIMWNDSLTPKYLFQDERHVVAYPRAAHNEHHKTEGTTPSVVGALSGYTINSDVDSHKTFAIAQSEIFDEDMHHTLTALTQPNGTDANYLVAYRTNSTTWEWKQSNMPFVYNVGNTNNWIQYDNAGTMTDATGGNGSSTRWLNSYLLLTNHTGISRFMIVSGRSIFTSLASAQAEDFSSFNIANLPSIECVAVYQLTWTTITSTSQGQCRLAATPKRISVNLIQASGAVAGTDHNSLTNLQGGTAGEYYHLTSAQHSSLISMAQSFELKSASFEAASNTTYFVDCSEGEVGCQLPTPSLGSKITIIDSSFSSDTYPINILPKADEKINNVQDVYAIISNGAAITLLSDGTNWFII